MRVPEGKERKEQKKISEEIMEQQSGDRRRQRRETSREGLPGSVPLATMPELPPWLPLEEQNMALHSIFCNKQ